MSTFRSLRSRLHLGRPTDSTANTRRRPSRVESDWGTRAFLVTSALSIARELWRHGEPELAERALELPPEDVLEIGVRTMRLVESGEDKRVWPEGTRNASFVIAAIEWLEGAPRPASRRTRLPERLLPDHLQATLMERYEATAPITALVHERTQRLPRS
jgi:hypothetical protein